MKIRILTHHSVHNHGAILQLYGLMQVLKKYDDTVCALDYKKNFDFLEDYADQKYNISLKSIPFYMKFLKEKGIKRTIFNIGKKGLLDAFKRKKNLIGEYYSRCVALDAVFVGSDEVFSIEPGLNPFFWGMGVPAKHVFSYGGCFGPTDVDFIKKKYALEYIKAGINRFEKISVRDQNSQNIIFQLSGKKIDQVCDPVILYGYKKEKEDFKKPISEKYLLVYAYDENMNEQEEVYLIKKYAKEKNLKVITAGFYHKWCDQCVNVSPIQLLEWVLGAECVVTDTFHGTVMSMIMNTPFVTKIRGNRNKLGFLLKEYELEDREISNFSNLNAILSKQIDFKKLNDMMQKKREEGEKFISQCIQEIKK